MERLYGLVFAAKRMVKGAATLTSFALRSSKMPHPHWKRLRDPKTPPPAGPSKLKIIAIATLLVILIKYGSDFI